jgi:nucleoside-diphosphate-sugar epimerase
MKKICVIGGSGFIGTRLCTRLRQSLDVLILDKAPSATHGDIARHADVTDVTSLRNGVPRGSIIINLAAEHRDDVSPRSLYDDVNVGGARNICTIARELDVERIVFTSSVAVYGFAPIGTDEAGRINPFNDYGRTKHQAEEVFRAWQEESPTTRSLVIIRPTVVFGEQNRGNVFNLLKQVASGSFVMIGNGQNVKSMAYVENVAAVLQSALSFPPGVHIYNYVDKPDLSMNVLVSQVQKILGGRPSRFRLPFFVGYAIGGMFDLAAQVTGRKFAISAIRVKKFTSNTMFSTRIHETGFIAPISLDEALERTVRHEFLQENTALPVFFSE